MIRHGGASVPANRRLWHFSGSSRGRSPDRWITDKNVGITGKNPCEGAKHRLAFATLLIWLALPALV